MLFAGDGDDVYLRRTEKAHSENCTGSSGDENLLAVFKVVVSCRGRGTEADVFICKGDTELTAVCVPGQHQIPFITAEIPTGFRVVR